MNGQQFREFLDTLTDEQLADDYNRQRQQVELLLDYLHRHPTTVSKAKISIAIATGSR